MTIQEKRKEIDAIDAAIIELLIWRSSAARDISMLKLSAGLPISDRSRESDVISNATRIAAGKVTDESILQIYEAIMAESRRVQQAVRYEVLRHGALR